MSLRDRMLAVIADVNAQLAEREEPIEMIAIALLTRKNLFIPIFSAALACSVIGAVTLTTVLRNQSRINNENARIR